MSNISNLSKKEINNSANTDLLIEYLESTIGDEMIINSFIRDMKVIKLTNSHVTISVNSEQTKNVLKKGYISYLEQAVFEVFSSKLEIILIVHGEELVYRDDKETIVTQSRNISSKYTFDNYVVGEFNNDVVDISKKIVDHIGKFSPLFITSASGLGKTHILHAIGNLFINKEYSAAYIEPNIFTGIIQEKSKESNEALYKYIESLAQYDVVLFDDIQNLGDRKVTLKVLFNIINKLFEDGKQVILVADKSPDELSGFEERFITRFQSGLTTKINHPSIEDLIEVIKFKLKTENLNPDKWEDKALKFIARNNSTSIRSIEGAIKRISFVKMSTSNIKYTYASIANIFKELTVDLKELTPSRILNTVANYYKLKVTDITGRSRKSNIVIARHMSIYLIRTINDLSYTEIGKIIGGRDHSTIMSGETKIKQMMKMNNAVKLASRKIEKNIKTLK